MAGNFQGSAPPHRRDLGPDSSNIAARRRGAGGGDVDRLAVPLLRRRRVCESLRPAGLRHGPRGTASWSSLARRRRRRRPAASLLFFQPKVASPLSTSSSAVGGAPLAADPGLPRARCSRPFEQSCMSPTVGSGGARYAERGRGHRVWGSGTVRRTRGKRPYGGLRPVPRRAARYRRRTSVGLRLVRALSLA
jgi:hypothetical protein